MRTEQRLVQKGGCPLCSTKMKQLGSHNYDFMYPEFKVSFYSCKSCRKVWEWKEGTYGQPLEIVDVAGKLRQIEKGTKIAT